MSDRRGRFSRRPPTPPSSWRGCRCPEPYVTGNKPQPCRACGLEVAPLEGIDTFVEDSGWTCFVMPGEPTRLRLSYSGTLMATAQWNPRSRSIVYVKSHRGGPAVPGGIVTKFENALRSAGL